AQHLRDARILTIYEGTTGIQANDLVGRKTARDGGASAKALAKQMNATLAAEKGNDVSTLRAQLSEAIEAFEQCVDWIVRTYPTDIKAVHAGAVPFLKLSALVCGGWQMFRAAAVAQRKLAAREGDPEFLRAKLGTARFYGDHLLSQVSGLRHAVLHGAPGVMALTEQQF
ncbi:MAG: acyl-CoA dehydrogenase, partial [Methyloceanibacter sp.]